MNRKLSLFGTANPAFSAARAAPQFEARLSTLPERVAQHIAARIQDGSLPAGMRIVEAEIAAHFGISHSPVRDALRLLNKRGLVELLPRRGARVASIDRDTLLDHAQVLSVYTVVALRRISRLGDKANVAELRKAIKEDAAALQGAAVAAKFDGDAFIALLGESTERILRAGRFSFLTDIMHRLLAKYAVLVAPLIEPANAAQIAARWRQLANVGKTPKLDEKFGWNFNVFSIEPKERNQAEAAHFPSPAGSLSGVFALRVPEYPEIQTYLDAVDALVMPDVNGHPTLAEQIADKIRESIHVGTIFYGDRLTEIDLAEHFLTSRGPVREALRILDEQGLIELRPRRGGIVNPLTVEQVDEIYDLRAATVSLSTGLAASKGLFTKQWRQMFETGLMFMERVTKTNIDDPIVWLELRRAVTKLIFHAASNDVAGRLALQFENRLATHYRLAEPTGRKQIIAGWRTIEDALVNGKADLAARLMHEQINRARVKAIDETRNRTEAGRRLA